MLNPKQAYWKRTYAVAAWIVKTLLAPMRYVLGWIVGHAILPAQRRRIDNPLSLRQALGYSLRKTRRNFQQTAKKHLSLAKEKLQPFFEQVPSLQQDVTDLEESSQNIENCINNLWQGEISPAGGLAYLNQRMPIFNHYLERLRINIAEHADLLRPLLELEDDREDRRQIPVDSRIQIIQMVTNPKIKQLVAHIDHLNDLSEESVTVTTNKGVKLDTWEIKKNGVEDPPYIIKFPSGEKSYTETLFDLRVTANKCNATVIGFDYPNVGRSKGCWVYSSDQLVQAGIAQVQRLLDKGITADKITLHGHILGGSIATQVADHFCNREEDPLILNLINDRSSSSTSDKIAGKCWTFISTVIKRTLKPILQFIDWDMNVVEVYKKMPPESKMIIVAKGDLATPYKEASLYQAIKPDLKAQFAQDRDTYKAITHSYKISKRTISYLSNPLHNQPLHELKDKTETPMIETVNTFIHANRASL